MNSCGLTEKQALIASKRLNLETTSNPDAVLTIFQDYGFTKSDISKIIILLTRDLENHIIPFFDFVKKIVGADKYVFPVFRRSKNSVELVERAMLNIQVLRDEGVPKSNIVKFLINQPRSLGFSTVIFKEILQEIKGMGFDPSKYAFMRAIHAITAMTKSTWETKLNAYRKWGLSEEQIQHAFMLSPFCMMHSVNKISSTMDYLVNRMGISSSHISEVPTVLTHSLEKRIIPRCSVYRSLVSKGLTIDGQFHIYPFLAMTDESFFDKYVIKYEEESPELKKIYKQAFNRHVMDEGVQGSPVKHEEEDQSEEEEEISAAPLDEKILDDSQASVLQKKVGLDVVEESKKAKRPKKVMKKTKKKLEECEDDQFSAKKKEKDKDKNKEEEEMTVVCMAGNELEDSESSVPKREVGIDKVEVLKKAKGPKEAFKKKLKKKVAEVQDSGAIKYVAEAPGMLQKKTSLSALVEQEEELKKIEEMKKAKKPKKVLKKRKKEVEDVQGSVAKKEEEDESKEEEEIVTVPIIGIILEDSHSSVLQKKLVLDTVEELKKVKRDEKLLKKSKKKVEEEQCSGAKKEEHEMSKERDEVVAASMVEKVLEDSQASVLECKVSLDGVDESKKAKKKTALKKQEQKANEVQGSAAIKYDAEVPELLQLANHKKASSSDLVKQEEELEEVSKKAKKRKKDLKKIKKKVDEVQGSALELLQESGSRAMKNSQIEEVAFCPERDAESVAALLKMSKVVDKSQGGKPKKKASSSHLVEQEEELKKIEETKKAKKLKKVSKKAKKKVEDVHASVAKKEEEDKSEEIVFAVPIIEKILEDSHSTVLKRKLVLDTVEETKKVKRAKKLLKTSKKKVVEEQCSAAKKEEHDKSKEEDEVAAVSMVEKVLEDSQASALKSKVSLDEVEESKKAIKVKKLLKKREKNAHEVQGGAAIKYDAEVPELLLAFHGCLTNEEVTFCPERATESVAGLLKVEKVVVESQAGKPNKKASSSHIVEQDEELLKEEVSKKAKKHKKVLKKIKKKVEEVPGSVPGLSQESDSRVMKDSQSEEVAFCPERGAESVAALSKVAKVVDKSQGGKSKKKAAKKKVEAVQGSVAKKEDEDKSDEVVVAAPIIRKILKTEEQCSGAKKKEHDKSKEEDEVAAVSMVEKVLEDSQASVLKSKVSLDEVEEVAAIKCDVEVPELLQALVRYCATEQAKLNKKEDSNARHQAHTNSVC
ncbi:hypothetical protein C5167_002006 [Papaver somniferum]|uniref:Uncharacterized protein n=1 Tax=Papaver somniferum TaxID=3469 RepID=A0A4Y7KSE7_PAPSO|nr:hypothetical protein C5167_002006 [Papaver somniferum]